MQELATINNVLLSDCHLDDDDDSISSDAVCARRISKRSGRHSTGLKEGPKPTHLYSPSGFTGCLGMDRHILLDWLLFNPSIRWYL